MSQRDDLGATFARLARALVAAEGPVLAERGVEMWEYVVLLALRDGPAASQARLSAATGRDATRLIPVLDGLEARGLARRTPDPADRRQRIVELTPAGAELVAGCRSSIRRMEERLLAELPGADRERFTELLERVADLVVGPPARP